MSLIRTREARNDLYVSLIRKMNQEPSLILCQSLILTFSCWDMKLGVLVLIDSGELHTESVITESPLASFVSLHFSQETFRVSRPKYSSSDTSKSVKKAPFLRRPGKLLSERISWRSRRSSLANLQAVQVIFRIVVNRCG